MAKNRSSVEKAHAQSEVRTHINRSTRRRIRSASRKANDALASGNKDVITAVAHEAIVAWDKAVSKKRLHPNAAARRKSRLMKKVNAALNG